MKKFFRLGAITIAALALGLINSGSASAMVYQSISNNFTHGICTAGHVLTTQDNGEVHGYTHGSSNSVDAKKCIFTQFVRVFPNGGGYYDRAQTSVTAYAETGGHSTQDLFTVDSGVWAVQLWSKAWNSKNGDSKWYVVGINADGTRYIG